MSLSSWLTSRRVGSAPNGMARGRSRVRRGRWAECPLCLERLETRALPSFLAPQAFDAGVSPWSVAVGDVNGDGHLDLAVAKQGGVSVLLGTGDGSFQTARAFPTPSSPWSVAVGDVNGDGRLDLAVDNWGSNSVSILLGNGDGSF